MPNNARTGISPDRLREIREQGHLEANRSPFVDPRAAAKGSDAIRRRGEEWAEAVLGRRFDRRSAVDPGMPWLRRGELETLMLADTEETDATFRAIVSDR